MFNHDGSFQTKLSQHILPVARYISIQYTIKKALVFAFNYSRIVSNPLSQTPSMQQLLNAMEKSCELFIMTWQAFFKYVRSIAIYSPKIQLFNSFPSFLPCCQIKSPLFFAALLIPSLCAVVMAASTGPFRAPSNNRPLPNLPGSPLLAGNLPTWRVSRSWSKRLVSNPARSPSPAVAVALTGTKKIWNDKGVDKWKKCETYFEMATYVHLGFEVWKSLIGILEYIMTKIQILV